MAAGLLQSYWMVYKEKCGFREFYNRLEMLASSHRCRGLCFSKITERRKVRRTANGCGVGDGSASDSLAGVEVLP